MIKLSYRAFLFILFLILPYQQGLAEFIIRLAPYGIEGSPIADDNPIFSMPFDATQNGESATKILKNQGWKSARGELPGMEFRQHSGTDFLWIPASTGDFVMGLEPFDSPTPLTSAPYLDIVWAIEQFSSKGDLRYWDTFDRAIIVYVNFGKPGFLSPPLSIGFAWDKNGGAPLGAISECIPQSATNSSEDCFPFYQKVRHFVVEQGGEKTVKRTRLDIRDYATQAFPDANLEKLKIHSIGFESKAKSGGTAIARLYQLKLSSE